MQSIIPQVAFESEIATFLILNIESSLYFGLTMH